MKNSVLPLLSFFYLIVVGSAADAQSFFRVPPTQISIHNAQLIEQQRNRTTISVKVPAAADERLEKIILTQLVNRDQWVWSSREPLVYLGQFSRNNPGEKGLANVEFSEERGELLILLNPSVPPGEQVNIVFRGYNPAAGIYQWSSEFVPEGSNPFVSVGPTLRLNIYQYAPML